jgi:glycerophosphoryl diester phosphodiesterase
VEPDLVLSKDGVLVCFHDLALKRTTDVESHPEFAHLRGNHSVIVDGKEQTIIDDWLVVDFTLAELKSLTVQQQTNGVRLQYFNELFPIATFQEFLDSIHKMSFKLGKPIGNSKFDFPSLYED